MISVRVGTAARTSTLKFASVNHAATGRIHTLLIPVHSEQRMRQFRFGQTRFFGNPLNDPL